MSSVGSHAHAQVELLHCCQLLPGLVFVNFLGETVVLMPCGRSHGAHADRLLTMSFQVWSGPVLSITGPLFMRLLHLEAYQMEQSNKLAARSLTPPTHVLLQEPFQLRGATALPFQKSEPCGCDVAPCQASSQLPCMQRQPNGSLNRTWPLPPRCSDLSGNALCGQVPAGLPSPVSRHMFVSSCCCKRSH